MKVPVIVCLPRPDFFGGKITSFKSFSLKNMSFLHIRNTKSFQTTETRRLEHSFKRKFGMRELPGGSVVTNTELCLQNNQGDLQQITGNLN